MSFHKFSDEFEHWITNDKNKTLGELIDIFGPRSFGLIFLMMLSIPSLPFPTGGITHLVLLPITIITALQLIIGRKSIWLPSKFRNIKLKNKLLSKALPFILKRVKWVEKYTRPRLKNVLNHKLSRSFLGLAVLVCAMGAFVSPPFSGLDTLPSMGGVLIALAIIFEDFAIAVIGLLVGILGISVIIGASSAVIFFIKSIF